MTRLTAIAAVLLAPTLAHAHPGHGSAGFAGGVLHPLTGIDHLLAMLAAGLWAAQLGGRARWVLPGTFLGVMLAGWGAGIAGAGLPFVEQGILASVLVPGLVLAVAARLRLPVAAGIAAGFAFLHGLAHAAEMTSGSAAAFGAGLVISTAVLQAAGLAVGTAMLAGARPGALRYSGAAVAISGLIIAFA